MAAKTKKVEVLNTQTNVKVVMTLKAFLKLAEIDIHEFEWAIEEVGFVEVMIGDVEHLAVELGDKFPQE